MSYTSKQHASSGAVECHTQGKSAEKKPFEMCTLVIGRPGNALHIVKAQAHRANVTGMKKIREGLENFLVLDQYAPPSFLTPVGNMCAIFISIFLLLLLLITFFLCAGRGGEEEGKRRGVLLNKISPPPYLSSDVIDELDLTVVIQTGALATQSVIKAVVSQHVFQGRGEVLGGRGAEETEHETPIAAFLPLIPLTA